jgi:hypothetical protein
VDIILFFKENMYKCFLYPKNLICKIRKWKGKY